MKTRTEIYTKGKYAVYEEIVALPNGKDTTYIKVVHPPSVVIIPQFDNGDILLIEQYRHCMDQYILELPAGTLDGSESLLNAAHRELREEAQLDAQTLSYLGVLYAVPAYGTEIQHVFHAKGVYASSATCDDYELINPKRVSRSELEQLILCGEIKDAMTLAALNKLFIKERSCSTPQLSS